jgi:hypothetical protein
MMRWFPHQFGDVPVTERKIQVPTHGTKDDFSFVMSPVEWVIRGDRHGSHSTELPWAAISQKNLASWSIIGPPSIQVTASGIFGESDDFCPLSPFLSMFPKIGFPRENRDQSGQGYI